MSEMIERVSNAMEEAEFGYSMNLISLIDGVSTYRLKYDDGETLEFGSTDDVYEHVADKRRKTQARAAIEAMRPATDAMKVAGGLKCEAIMFEGEGSGVIFNDMGEVFTTMIDAALSEGKPE